MNEIIKKALCLLILLLVTNFLIGQNLSDIIPGISIEWNPSIRFNHIAIDAFGLIGDQSLAIGIGLKTIVGLGYDALFMSPYVRLEYKDFYCGVGPLFLIVQPLVTDEVTLVPDTTIFYTCGIALPIFEHGFGRLALNLGFDVSLTPYRYNYPNSENLTTNLFTYLMNPYYMFINPLANHLKFNVGLVYFQYF